MEKSKLLAVVSYITWVGWIIALIMRDKNDSLVSCHLNQALMLNIVCTIGSIISRFGLIGGIIGWVINAAGLGCGKISDMLGLTGYRIIGSKDDYIKNNTSSSAYRAYQNSAKTHEKKVVMDDGSYYLYNSKTDSYDYYSKDGELEEDSEEDEDDQDTEDEE